MSVFSDFLDQLRAQQSRPPVRSGTGTSKHPVIPNWDSRVAATRSAAISGDVDGNVFRDVPLERYGELGDVYRDTTKQLRERDQLEADIRGRGVQPVVLPDVPVVAAGQYTTPNTRHPEDARHADQFETLRRVYPELQLLPPYGDYLDEEVARRGWHPSDFEGMTPGEAAGIIASQLKAHRIRAMGQGAPDYVETLPIY